MSLKLLCFSPPFPFSLTNPNPNFSPSSDPPLPFHSFRTSQTPKKILSYSSPDPLFLPLLDQHQQQQQEPLEEEEEEEEEEVNDEEEDPIRTFLKRRDPRPDPVREGRFSLQKNRRTSWRVADTEPITGEDAKIDLGSILSDPIEGLEEKQSGEDGIVSEIVGIARDLPENVTIGEFLGPYEGRIGEGECVEVLERLGEEGFVWECLYFFEWMRSREQPMVSPKAVSALFPVLGRAGMGVELMVLFKNLPRGLRFSDVRVYNATISSLSSCRRYADAWKVYEAMETNNIRPDHVTCSILITVMRKSGRSAKDAWEFFERMNKKGIEWRLEVLGALVKCFCDEGLVKEALIIQSEMEKRGIRSNVIIYNTLMDAYVKSDKVEEAEGLFKEMKERGLKPTAPTYNILMDAYSRRMQPEIVENLLSEMQSLGLKPNVKSYTCLTSAYGRKRKMSDRAADAFLKMRKAGIKPTSHSYTALIHAYSVDGWHEKAYAAFESMRREGITPPIETYTALLDAYRRAGDARMLMDIWKWMMQDKIEGTRVTFNILLDGLAKQGHYLEARDVIYEFGRLGLSPTVMTYNMLMNAYARGGQHNKLPQLLREMAALNLKPDSITYSTMIYAYVRVRDFTRAFYYHKQMVNSRQVPDARSYEKLRSLLDVKAAIKNRRDKNAILGIVNSTMALEPKRKGKKDEFWKNKKKRFGSNRLVGSS
ncbi:Pentatricopeptide repeat-containing protein [Acorus calamus]|uniref:Pentatricopeptide repeat-containing protein n=1 Tax=Acorus calamus TaxID=4465 RepID=A0AAV9CPB0_ACOCL|nr:Pentatricopeptide repeat-containing protein [Acorus calamus]